MHPCLVMGVLEIDKWKLVENESAVSFKPDVSKPRTNGDFNSLKHLFNASVQFLTSKRGCIIGFTLTVILSTCLPSGGSRKRHFTEVPSLPSDQR